MRPGRADEEGYALVAVVAAILVFAAVSLSVVETGRRTFVSAQADIDNARLSAALDAGLAVGTAELLDSSVLNPAALDGRSRQVRFGDAALTVTIQDEQGKVPLNALDEDEVRRMFELLGASGERLDILTDSFLDWTDDDDDPRPNGAEADYYAAQHIHPRNGMLRSIEEIGLIRGADPSLVARLEDVATVHFGKGGFKPARASVFAIRVVEGDDEGAVDIITRGRELSNQRTALSIGEHDSLVGQPVTVVVDATLADGAHRRGRSLVELTGHADQPFVVRERN